jgi:hypothetical protein
MLFIFFVFTFPLLTYGQYATKKRANEILRKYYTEDEIREHNIHFVEVKSQLRLSNGVVFPEDDRLYYQNNTFALILGFGAVLIAILVDIMLGGRNVKFLYWMLTERNIRDNIIKEARKNGVEIIFESQWQYESRYNTMLREKYSNASSEKDEE